MPPQLYLHVGHGKTGSSFIQSSLAKSAELLKKNKIYYPIREENRISAALGHISSGNGGLLLDSNFVYALTQRNITTSILFSSELLFNQLLDNVENIEQNIFELVNKLKIKQIHVLLFIRNPPEMISSIYQQSVKRGGFYQDIQNLETNYLNLFRKIPRFIELIKTWENTTLTILNYSNVKNFLLNEFEQWLALNDKLLTPDITLVNRSLTYSELELQKIINKSLGSAGGFLSDNLCEKLPYIKSDSFAFPLANKQSFIEKISPIVDNINAMISPKHQLTLNHWPEHANEIFYTFTKPQLEVIGESFANAFLKEKNKTSPAPTDSYYLSLTYKISNRLSSFPRLKNVLKKTLLFLIKLANKTKELGLFTSFP